MATEKVQPDIHEAPLSPERRAFLSKISIALSAVAAAVVGIPVVGFLLGPLLQTTAETWRSVGKADSFQVGTTVKVTFIDPSPLKWAGVTAKTAAWLRRVGEDHVDAGEYPLFRCRGSRQHFAAERPYADVECEIRESAADIDSQASGRH